MFRRSTSGHTGLCGSDRALEYLGHQAAKTSAGLFEFAHIDAVPTALHLLGSKVGLGAGYRSRSAHQDIIWVTAMQVAAKVPGCLSIELDDICRRKRICRGKSRTSSVSNAEGATMLSFAREDREHYIGVVLASL